MGPGLPHTWDSDPARRGPNEAVFCQFSPDFLGPEFLAAPELLPVRRLLERSARGLRFTGRTQREVAERMDGMERLEGPGRLIALLHVLAALARSRDARPLSSRAFAPSTRRGDAERIDRVCRHLTEHYTDRVPLAEAARVAHLSIPAFSRFFKVRTGRTLVAYLNELRVGRACRALIETDRPVSDIAFDSGFNNLSNFNRRFRDAKGLSPRAFRAQFHSR